MKPFFSIFLAVIVTLGFGAIAGETLTGCAAWQTFVAALPVVSGILADGNGVLNMIENTVNAYFLGNPNPAQQAKIDAALTKTQQALLAGERALAGLTDATEGQVAAAFTDFAAAYAELMQLIAPLGIVSESATVTPSVTAGAPAKAPTVIPDPIVLKIVKAQQAAKAAKKGAVR